MAWDKAGSCHVVQTCHLTLWSPVSFLVKQWASTRSSKDTKPNTPEGAQSPPVLTQAELNLQIGPEVSTLHSPRCCYQS